MRKTSSFVNSQLDRSTSDFSKSILFTQTDSQQCISECPTVLSQIDFMEGSHRDSRNSQDLDCSFKKQLTQSCYDNRSTNPNVKKSKILVVQSRIISGNSRYSAQQEMSKEEFQLQSIERRTQELVLKEKQQRKQLKQLKKLYVQKMDQLTRQSETHLLETSSLNQQINSLMQQKSRLIIEKQAIQLKLNNLEVQMEQTQAEIRSVNVEKQQLMHRLQLLEANFKTEHIPNHQEQSLIDFDKQIHIIDKLIYNCKKQHKQTELSKLLQIKIELLQRRQSSKIREETIKKERAITQLNQIISSRNQLVRAKNKIISQLSHSKLDQCGKQEKEAETADSFFTKQAPQENVLNVSQADEDVGQWDTFKISVRKLIESNHIIGHEETYHAIQSIVLGLIHLFEGETCCEDDVLELLDISLDRLNTQYVSKARSHLSKLEKISSQTQINFNKVTHEKLKQKENITPVKTQIL